MTGLSQIRSESAICAQNQVSISKPVQVRRGQLFFSSARPATESNSEPEH